MIVMGCQISRQFMQVSLRNTADDVEDLLPDRFGSARSYAFARSAASPWLNTTAAWWTWHGRIIDGKRADGQAFVRIPRGRAMGSLVYADKQENRRVWLCRSYFPFTVGMGFVISSVLARPILLIFLSESTPDPTVERCLLPVHPAPTVRNVR